MYQNITRLCESTLSISPIIFVLNKCLWTVSVLIFRSYFTKDTLTSAWLGFVFMEVTSDVSQSPCNHVQC